MKIKGIGKRFISFMLTAAMIFGLVVLPDTSVSAEEIASSSSSSLLSLDEQAPAALAAAKNPYGYEKGVAFTLSTGHEIVYLGGWNGNNETKELNGDSISDLKSFVKAPNKASGGISMPSGTWNWVQAVAFDNDTNSAKDNQILFVGVEEDQYAYAWVYDYANAKIIGPTQLGNMSWIGTDYDQYSSTSLFDVAAGDFNGDGKDTLLVYVPLNSSGAGCTLYELTYNGSSLSVGSSGNHLLMDQYINDQNNGKYTDHSDTDDTCRDKLAVSMQVGDYNGDNIDDLAVFSYSHYRHCGGSTAYYNPKLKISYGGTDVTGISKLNADQTMTISSSSGSTLIFPVAASLAAGDYNGDGFDDLYIVGVKASTTSGSSISADGSQWYARYISGNIDGKMLSHDTVMLESNAWFEDGFYASDECYGEVMAAGVAISGSAAPEMLFIAGTLYDVSTGVPVEKLKSDYFDEADDGLNSHIATNTFMQSLVVGNFDNNEAGREQAAFIIGMKQTNQDDYYFKSGFVCGTDFADGEYADGSTYYGAAGDYYCTDIDEEANYIHEDKGDDPDEGLNCMFIALDHDDDSVIAKYLGANYIYTDPEVRAVLQAAPYFGDISAYGKNSTGYTLETSYSFSESDTNTLAGSVGFAFSGSVPFAATTSGAAGVKVGWSGTFTDTTATNYKETFAASSEDVVIVNRIPLIVYQYDIMVNNAWTGSTQMEFTVPSEPVYETMTLDGYNDFVTEYNQMMEDAGIEGYKKMVSIDPAANWMDGNEGNPYAYNQNGWNNSSIKDKQISASSYSLGKANAATTITWTESNTTSESNTATCGFYTKCSVLFGPKAIANYGIELAGEYTHGWGYAETEGTAIGASCTVQDLNGTALIENGMDEDTLKLYSFTWTFGQWERDLGMKDENGNPVNTVFLGYALTNVSSPPLSVTDLAGQVVDENAIKLAWTKPDTPTGWPDIDGYMLYQGVENADGTVSYYPLIDLGGNNTSITVAQLLNDEKIQYDTEYTFMIRTAHTAEDGSTVYGGKSNIAAVHTPNPSYTVDLEYDETAVDVTAVQQGGTAVADGDKVLQDTIIKVEGKAADDYKITKMTIYDESTKKTQEISPSEDGKSVTCYYQVKGNVKVTVETKKIITEAEVTFTDKVYDENDSTLLTGTITAEVDGIKLSSGAVVTGPVTFTAAAEEGYVLTAWQVTVDDKTYKYATNDKTEFTMGLLGEKIHVTAVFDLKTNVHEIITVENPSEGGTIALYDKDGVELVPGEDGTYNVQYGTEVTFAALPDTGYVIDAWTRDAAGQTEDRFTIEVTKDITVGIIYRAPVKYKLTYTAEDENGNLVAVDPYVESGSSVAAGTKLNLTATAADGYRIEKWTITQGTETEEYILDDACYTTDTKEVTMDSGTTVEVSFVEIEQYTVTVTKTGEGTISIVKGNKILNNGDKVRFMNHVVLIAEPADGWKLADVEGWTSLVDGIFHKRILNIRRDQSIDVVFEEVPVEDEDKNDESDKPDDTAKPDDTDKPDDTAKPDGTDKPDDTQNNTGGSGNDTGTAGGEGSTGSGTGSSTGKDTNTGKNTGSGTKTESSAKTGDSLPVLTLVGVLASCAIICIILIKKKYRI